MHNITTFYTGFYNGVVKILKTVSDDKFALAMFKNLNKDHFVYKHIYLRDGIELDDCKYATIEINNIATVFIIIGYKDKFFDEAADVIRTFDYYDKLGIALFIEPVLENSIGDKLFGVLYELCYIINSYKSLTMYNIIEKLRSWPHKVEDYSIPAMVIAMKVCIAFDIDLIVPAGISWEMWSDDLKNDIASENIKYLYDTIVEDKYTIDDLLYTGVAKYILEHHTDKE